MVSCPECLGYGYDLSGDCTTCKGKGLMDKCPECGAELIWLQVSYDGGKTWERSCYCKCGFEYSHPLQ